MAPLTLYHGPPTRSVRLLIALDELGVTDFELKDVDFMAGGHLTPEHTAVSKGTNTLPVLIIDDQTVIESGAGLQLILERFGNGRLQPAVDSKDRAAYLHYLWFAEATLSQAIVLYLMHTVLLPEDQRDPKSAERGKKATIKALDALETHLADGNKEWVAGGQLSAADINLIHGLFLSFGFAKIVDKASHPHAHALFERIMSRPSAQKAYGKYATPA